MIKIISLADRFTKDEWTLRDTQRYLYKRKNRYGSRPGGLYIPTVFGPWAIASDFQSLGIYFNSLDEYISVIDRMVRKYGPDALVKDLLIDKDEDSDTEPKSRKEAERTDHKIGSNEVSIDSEHINPDAQTHGGDGNSGEMDHEALTKTSDREIPEDGSSDGLSDHQDQGDETKTGGENLKNNHTPDGKPLPDTDGTDCRGDSTGGHGDGGGSSKTLGLLDGQGACGADEATAGMSARTDRRITDADKEASGKRCPAQGVGDLFDQKPSMRHFSHHRDAGAPVVTTTLRDVRRAAIMRRALARLIHPSPNGKTSPLWDGKKLVREMITRQVRLHRMKKDIQYHPLVMLLPDTSGSCEKISKETSALAVAVARNDSRLIVGWSLGREGQVHVLSHGCARELEPKAKKLGLLPEPGLYFGLEPLVDWATWHTLGVDVIVVLGDAHGNESYLSAAENGIKVFWLDPNPYMHPDYHHPNIQYAEATDVDAMVEALDRLT